MSRIHKLIYVIFVYILFALISADPASTATIWSDDFESYAVGTTSSTDKWDSTGNPTGYWEVRDISNKFFAGNDLDGEAVWISTPINISAYSNDVAISLNIAETGTMTGSDYLRGYYKLDGGGEILFFEQVGQLATGSTFVDRSTIALTGSTLQVVIRADNSTSSKNWRFDDILVTGTLGGPDTTAPSAISNLTALTGTTQGTVQLKWTAPGDDDDAGGDISKYTVKYATYKITDINFDETHEFEEAFNWTPSSAGSEEDRLLTGLGFGTTYYFAIKAKDSSNNVAEWSTVPYTADGNVTFAKFHPQGYILDEGFESFFPPLEWTNTNTEQSSSEKNGGAFSVNINNGSERIVTPVLENPGTLEFYLFASAGASSFYIERGTTPTGPWTQIDEITADLGGVFNLQQYDLSSYNNIHISFRRGGSRTYYLDDVTVSGPDSTPPGAVTNLTALQHASIEGAIVLNWTAPGDDGNSGTAASYEIKVSSVSGQNIDNEAAYNLVSDISVFSPSTITNPLSAGSTQAMTVTGLVGGNTYYFAIKAFDEQSSSGTWSRAGGLNVNNFAISFDTNPAIPSGLLATALSTSSIQLTWNANNEADFNEYQLEYSSYSNSAGFQSLISTTVLTYDHLSLDSNNTYYYKIRAQDINSNLSDFSSVVSTLTLSGGINIIVSKSTSTALAKPGEEVTYTVTYENTGGSIATGFTITDSVPFNTYISEAAGSGSADNVEYYVGSSWTGVYDSTATRIRWTDNSVPGGSGSLTVTYKVKIE